MKVEKNMLPKSIVEFIVEASTTEVAKHRKKAIAHLKEHADIKGFRKGADVPEDILVKNYWESYIAQMTVESAIDSIYRDLLKKEKLLPVAEGEIKEIISQDPLKIKIHIEVFPEISIDKKYKDIKLKKQKVSVTAAEVKGALDDIQTRFTQFEPVTSKAAKIKMGDKVTIDTDGYDEKGVLLETTSMRDYPIVLGSGLLVPGFEEGVVGAKAGDELELPIEFPKDYHSPDFAGKKTNFKVIVKSFEKAVKPEFTPEFIKNLRGKDLDLEGFKALIKEEITETKQANVRLDEENELIDALLKVTKLDIGDKLLSRQIEKVYEEIKENVSKDGIKMSDYIESLKMTEETYKEANVKPVALKRLEGELILHKLVEMEDTKVSDEEVQKEIAIITKRFENEEVLARLKDLYVPGNNYYEELKQRIGYRNVIESFFA